MCLYVTLHIAYIQAVTIIATRHTYLTFIIIAVASKTDAVKGLV